MNPGGQKRPRSKSPEKSPRKTPKVVYEEVDKQEEYEHCLRFGQILLGLFKWNGNYHETLNSLSEFQSSFEHADYCEFYRIMGKTTEYTEEIRDCVQTVIGFYDELVEDKEVGGLKLGSEFLDNVIKLARMIINTTECPANPRPVKREKVFAKAMSLVAFCNKYIDSCPIQFEDMEKIFKNIAEKYSSTN